MAQPTTNGILKFLFKAIILPIIVFVLVVGIAVLVVGNMTPTQLGVADLEFAEGMSITSLGFADTKIFDIIKMFRTLFAEPNLADIVSNPPDEEVEGPIVEGNLSGSALGTGGTIDYLAIADNEVVYDDEYLYEYNDTTLAYMLNQIIKQGSAQAGEGGDQEAAQAFKDINANVEEIIINVEGSERTMRFVISINVTSLIAEATAQANNPAIEFALNRLPEKVYMVSDFTLSADANGKLVMTSEALRINDQENAISELLLGILAGKVEGEGGEGGENTNVINDGFAEIVTKLVGNLGKVGTATKDSNNVVTGGIVLGSEGIMDGKISVITYNSDPTPEV